jgi:hypothetical protein
MRPFVGVLAEVVTLAALLSLAPIVPRGLPFALYVVATQLFATYLIHCPAHYMVGRAAGIRFRSISLGRTTIANILPRRAAGIAQFFPVLTLSTDRTSMAEVQKWKVSAMYASGTIASVASAFAIAIFATLAEPLDYSAWAWVIAGAYLAFDVVFSPKSGDLMRARAALHG